MFVSDDAHEQMMNKRIFFSKLATSPTMVDIDPLSKILDAPLAYLMRPSWTCFRSSSFEVCEKVRRPRIRIALHLRALACLYM